MSNNLSSSISKGSCDRCSKASKGSSHKSEKTHKTTTKKVLASKKIISSYTDSKSCSSSVVTKKNTVKPKKITKSDLTVTKKLQNNVLDFCKNCGDSKGGGEINKSQENIHSLLNAMNIKCVKNDNNIKIEKEVTKPLQEYYKNENFNKYAESMHDTTKKVSLDTIKEVSEVRTISDDTYFRIFPDSEDEVTYLDTTSDENIKRLQEFRQKNYFECHSAKSRIKNRISATSLIDHKCVYRFYLNDRLFPVPLNTDYNNKVRCVECHLPMDIKQDTSSEKINGTIQAKVKLGTGDAQDLLLLLPVKDSLIIEERRKENRQENEYVYFGVVKLSADGNSVFNRNLPENSLALKYQKGYQEYQHYGRYQYEEIKQDDVIII